MKNPTPLEGDPGEAAKAEAAEPEAGKVRPASPEAGLRWLRAALCAACALSFLALLVALVLVARRGSRLQGERDRLDAFAMEAAAALDRVLERLDQPRFARIPQIEGLRKDILAELESCSKPFVQGKDPDRLDKLLTALSQARLGRIHASAGRDKEAMDAFKQAVQLLEDLSIGDPSNPSYRSHLAQTCSAVAAFHENKGRYEQAALASVRAVETFGALAPEYREGLDAAYFRMGLALQRKGESAQAVNAFGRAALAAQVSSLEKPLIPAHRHIFGESKYWMGVLHAQAGGLSSAEDDFRAALKVQEKLAAEAGSAPEHRAALARSYLGLAAVLARTGKLQEAIAAATSAVSLAEKLVSEFPYSPAQYTELAGACRALASVQQSAGNPQEAEAAQRKAVSALESLVEKAGSGPEDRLELARGLVILGTLLVNTGRPAEAREPIARSKNILDALAAEFPGQPQYREAKALSLHHLAILLSRQGEGAQAIEAFREASALQEKLVSDDPSPAHESQLGETLSNLALQLLGSGELSEARALVEKAIAHQKTAVSASPGISKYLEDLRNHHSVLTEILLRQGDHTAAAKKAEELPGYFPQRAEDAFMASCYLAQAASLASRDASLPEAERTALSQARADRAMELLKSSVRAGLRDPERLKAETALDLLRDREDFKSLLQTLGAAK
jgi:tetratricopeptide (TPR) repeat protein